MSAQINDWLSHAACIGEPIETFFPTDKGPGNCDTALALCSVCDVVTKCLEFAITNDLTYGVYGGKTSTERAGKSSRRGRPPAAHGSAGRYQSAKHKCRCDRCTAAYRAYRAQRRLDGREASATTQEKRVS